MIILTERRFPKVTVADGKRGNPNFKYMGQHPRKKGSRLHGYSSILHTDVYFTMFFGGIEYRHVDNSKTKKDIVFIQKRWKDKGYFTRRVKHVSGKGWSLYVKEKKTNEKKD